jgi:PPM family protein phosphatase
MHLVEGTSMVLGKRATYAGATDVGRVRQCNEDSLLLLPEAGVFAVADGLGGLDAGDLASSIALSRLHDLSLSSDEEGTDPAIHLQAMVAAVNHHTYEQRVALGRNMATTLAVVRFSHRSAFVAHVGDSRMYLWHNDTLAQLTHDHSLVNNLCEQGALTANQARYSPQRHVITRAVGAAPTVQPSIKPVAVVPGDVLLLCTDGLTSMVTDEEIAACLQTGPVDAGRLVEQLVHLANEAGGHDNITVIGITIRE